MLRSPLFWNSVLAFVYRCSGALVTFVFGVGFARMMSIQEYGALVSLMTFGFVAATIGGAVSNFGCSWKYQVSRLGKTIRRSSRLSHNGFV